MPLYLILIFIFAAIGIVDTIYLSYHVIKNTSQTCRVFPQEWCDRVQSSPQSRTFGIPNAFAGFGIYVAIMFLATLFFKSIIPFWPIATLITIGFLFSLYFTYVQAFVLKAFCTWCVVSAINFTVLAASVYIMR